MLRNYFSCVLSKFDLSLLYQKDHSKRHCLSHIVIFHCIGLPKRSVALVAEREQSVKNFLRRKGLWTRLLTKTSVRITGSRSYRLVSLLPLWHMSFFHFCVLNFDSASEVCCLYNMLQNRRSRPERVDLSLRRLSQQNTINFVFLLWHLWIRNTNVQFWLSCSFSRKLAPQCKHNTQLFKMDWPTQPDAFLISQKRLSLQSELKSVREKGQNLLKVSALKSEVQKTFQNLIFQLHTGIPTKNRFSTHF